MRRKNWYSTVLVTAMVTASVTIPSCSCSKEKDERQVVYKIKKSPDAGVRAAVPTKALMPVYAAVFKTEVWNFGGTTRQKLKVLDTCDVNKDLYKVWVGKAKPYRNTRAGTSYFQDLFYLKNSWQMNTDEVRKAMETEGVRPATFDELINFSDQHKNEGVKKANVYALGAKAQFSNGKFAPFTNAETCMSVGMELLDPYGNKQWKPGTVFLVTRL